MALHAPMSYICDPSKRVHVPFYIASHNAYYPAGSKCSTTSWWSVPFGRPFHTVPGRLLQRRVLLPSRRLDSTVKVQPTPLPTMLHSCCRHSPIKRPIDREACAGNPTPPCGNPAPAACKDIELSVAKDKAAQCPADALVESVSAKGELAQTSSATSDLVVPHMSLSAVELTSRLLGQGAFARILEGEIKLKQRRAPVAVKILKEPSVENKIALQRESKMMYMCRHHGVARVIGAQIQPIGPTVLIMEKYHGSLSALRACLTPKKYVAALAHIAGGMGHLWDLLVSHGDIKASNMLVRTPWQVVLADFECAKKVPFAEFRTSEVTGTPAFWSPEAWQTLTDKGNCKHIPLKTDAFAFGMVFKELAGDAPRLRRQVATIDLALEGLLQPEEARSSVRDVLQRLPLRS